MKIAILSTDTPHHAYFVKTLKNIFSDITVYCETKSNTHHPLKKEHSFEVKRDIYECQRWFGNEQTKISEITSVKEFSSMNDASAIASLKKESLDIVIVFGTGVLKPPLIEICSQRIFNLHGADPENYRGLDTHLWAIYHKDFGGLITTLHHLDTGLDTGNIVLQGAIPLHHKMKLHELRAANTEVCVKLTISVIDMMNRFGEVTSRSQYKEGRYYSAMPSELKDICQKRFETYTKGLAHDS